MKMRSKDLLLIMSAVFLGAFTLTGCSDDDDDISLSDVPSAVQETFYSMFPGVTAHWELVKTYYEAEFEQNGKEVDVWFSADGTWLRTETEYTGTLPSAVTAYIATNYPDYTIDSDDIEYVETPSGDYYKIEIEKKGSSDIELKITADGELFT